MSKTLLISNFCFVPDKIDLFLNEELQVKVLPHPRTKLNGGKQLWFKLEIAGVKSPKLYPGEVFTWTPQTPGTFVVKCPLYPRVRAAVNVLPSQPNSLLNGLTPNKFWWAKNINTTEGPAATVFADFKWQEIKAVLNYRSIK